MVRRLIHSALMLALLGGATALGPGLLSVEANAQQPPQQPQQPVQKPITADDLDADQPAPEPDQTVEEQTEDFFNSFNDPEEDSEEELGPDGLPIVDDGLPNINDDLGIDGDLGIFEAETEAAPIPDNIFEGGVIEADALDVESPTDDFAEDFTEGVPGDLSNDFVEGEDLSVDDLDEGFAIERTDDLLIEEEINPMAPIPDANGISRVAVIRGLDKITARVRDVEAPVGVPVMFERFEILVQTCSRRPPEETPETTAFVQITEHNLDGSQGSAFSGWMFASSPAMNPVEHPVYDVWLIDCRTL